MKIKIDFISGKQITFDTDSKEKLSKIDKNREAYFLFNSFEIFSGFSDGKVDEDGDFIIKKAGSILNPAFPYKRLMGWKYKRKQ